MRSKAEMHRVIKRQKFLYRVVNIGSRLIFGTLLTWVAVMIVIEAGERVGLFAIVVAPLPILAFYAFLIPNDHVQPFIDWKNSIERLEQELAERLIR